MQDTARAAAQLRREDGHRLHRLVDLACDLCVSADHAGLLGHAASPTSRRAGCPSSTSSTSADVNFALEVHPTEIAFDIASAAARDRGGAGPPPLRLQLRPQPPGLPGRGLREVPAQLPRPHLQRPHEGRVVGHGRRHGGRVRRPHQLRRRAPHLGLPQRRARHGRFRVDHRRAQRHRLRGPAVGGVGRQPHGPRAWRHRKRGILPAARLQAGRPAPSTRPFPGSKRGDAGVRRASCAMRWSAAASGAFIGAVHRKAMALDGQIELVAGALSSQPDKARASGRELGLRDSRNHGSWQDLLADELKRAAGRAHRLRFHRHAQPHALPGRARRSSRRASMWCATSRWCTPAQQADAAACEPCAMSGTCSA